jgi:hypothetical protein
MIRDAARWLAGLALELAVGLAALMMLVTVLAAVLRGP